jgi:hypothetical protein
MNGYISYCNNVDELIRALGHDEHKPENWQLFIDYSKLSLKFVLHSWNDSPSISVAILLEYLLIFETYSFLLVMSLVIWNSSAFPFTLNGTVMHCHCSVIEWPRHKQILPGQKNVANDPLVDPQKIVQPPLHIKLRLMKNSVKAMNRNTEGFRYL